MKKKIFKLICLTLIIAAITTQVFAAGSVSTSMSASSTSVNSGDTITVTVSASVDSCGSGGIKISYDSSVFQFVSGKWVLGNTFMSDFSSGSNDGVFAFLDSQSISGSVFQFELKVKDNASLGSSTVSATFKADGKSSSCSSSISVVCSHSYSNSCDTSCNLCGSTRSISHSWNSGSYSKNPTCSSTGTKVYTCKVCGTTKSETASKTSHTYDNSCDESCNVCGSTRSIEHTFEWNIQGEGHIQKCSVCGLEQNYAVHTLESEASSNDSGYGYKCSVCQLIPNAKEHKYDSDCDADCNECGYTRTVTHAYNETPVYDADVHWYKCMICDAVTLGVPHEPGDAATEETDQICVTCGYVIEKSDSHEHKKTGIWYKNDVGHWTHCACLKYFDPEAHVLSEGVVDEENKTITYECTICKHKIVEDIPEETVPETIPEETEPVETETQEISFYGIPLWMILAAALGISIIGNIVFIICASKKKRGHYSK